MPEEERKPAPTWFSDFTGKHYREVFFTRPMLEKVLAQIGKTEDAMFDAAFKAQERLGVNMTERARTNMRKVFMLKPGDRVKYWGKDFQSAEAEAGLKLGEEHYTLLPYDSTHPGPVISALTGNVIICFNDGENDRLASYPGFAPYVPTKDASEVVEE